MKKFCKKAALYIAAIILFDVLFCSCIDPYNVMHVNRIRDNGVEPNKNYIKMSYILRNPDKFDSFVFGSSRVGNIHVENIENERCYNMTTSEGLPEEHLDNIKTLIDAGIIPKRIYVGVDSLSYTREPEVHLTQQLRIPYEYLKADRTRFLKAYFDPEIVGKAYFKEIRKHKPSEAYVERFYNFGWNSDYNRKTSYDFDNAKPDIGPYTRIDETLEAMAGITELCRNNGIELVVFTNPMYSVTYKASLDRGYLQFLEKLAKITPYYNFSGYNGITTDRNNYIDTSHYTAEVSDMLLNCMCKGRQYEGLYSEGFGMYVTDENIDQLLDILLSQTE